MQAIFAWQFGNPKPISPDSPQIITKIKKIDQLISQYAPKWPLEKINKVDLAILRIAIWEIISFPDVPQKVIIDEAVELAKEFGSDSSASFINGVLGTTINQNSKKENDQP
ncbi:transcription antitermination factor NusB [Candidatus Shapirobacteria bacterium RIFOXYD1_FULL_38_32]|uniref:Transcription antitermination factor NusB n=1 Tax=Candidatus Shapirobacteria bacterium RIFOXYB1_FULL_38_38 TaxID=1802151 RepID=A0A1F7SWU5_9BACT|nr:MAG: transcription antitermination factor NusB [Candidatus Shapirobacteria bacterium RIFOXYC1_FULL_38_24]OGL57647.1 MAG: transcription antitermination factor NusB [Candidatus Shapirobacteria bacterium RIFOXYB1_FULL_38_38]OGL57885.1 MAG: transcription antitermination factor NusB [Candidatus Shapirobacteria bacterium RIFOXYD1_FULL_38_32]HAP37486.1 transcription antitermination factor NusB [Candidatus Shapirobacteria bacterium]HCU54840.1 transcription antitermination factor NusB [Candidatus Sha